MILSDYKFVGYANAHYLFIDKNGKQVKFSKCRKDLIEEYKLNNNDNLNQWFKISYFQAQPINKNDDLLDRINIISDMKIIII